MKNYFWLSIFCSLLISCSQENIPPICIDDICIDGEWEWVKSYGSIAGLTITPESINETRKLIISESKYQEFVNDELIHEVEYEFVKSDELSNPSNEQAILKLAMGGWYLILEENGNLNFIEPCADCWEHTYKKN